MERRYVIKEEAKEYMHNHKITNRKIARKLGVTEGYISSIKNARKTEISKLMAYAFCKAVDSELELENVFEIF